MTDESRGESAKKTEVVVGPPAIPDIYVNTTAIYVGAYDVTLRLCQEAPDLVEEGTERRVVAQIRMAHAQAWTAAHITLRLLDNLVKTHGPFLVTGDLLDRLNLSDEYRRLQELADATASD